MRNDREPSFFSDLGFAAGTWARFPWLPPISVAFILTQGSLLPEPLWALGLFSAILYAGWVGTERIVYLRSMRGGSISSHELRRLTVSFVPRYATLAIVAFLPFVPLVLMLQPETRPDGSFSIGPAFFITTAVIGVVLDVGLTFVTPALAFTTRRVRDALRLGVRMIGTEWPRCLRYVLVPPLAIVAGTQLLTWRRESLAPRLAATILATLLNLLFKGATAAFYLRRHEVGDNGAAFLPRFPASQQDTGSS